ncbi:MAG: translation initiation factor IF-2 [Flavobacteriales bacterium]|nr:translation initiation factor IF-2 [Flavobacteriales bacterium]
MTKSSKPVRLSKVARELNVGIVTITEFLDKKGISIDSSPNTKIEPDVYELLIGEFQGEKAVKEKSEQILTRTREQRESVSIESTRKSSDEDDEEEGEEEAAAPAPTPTAAPAPEPKPAPAPAPEVKPAVEEAPKEEKKEEPVAAKPSEEQPKPAEKPEEKPAKEEPKVEDEVVRAKASAPGVKVLGKVDLEGLNKNKKKEEEKPAAEKVEKEAPKPKEEPAPEAPAAPKEPELIKARAEKLEGVKVLRKIELKEEPKKKKATPVASSSDSADDRKKRKRKRVSKVDVSKQAQQNRKGGAPASKQKGAKAKPEISEADIQKEIKETLARLSGKGKSKSAKLRRQKRDERAAQSEEEMARAAEDRMVLKLTEFVTVSELASMMDKQATDIISACMSLGIFASINQRLDAETISIIAEEFGYQVEFVSSDVQEAILEEEDAPDQLKTRPPIVTVMGHVDHGKTSLLDYVRKANVIAGEAGGITQHIGAYGVQLDDGRKITFLDTPGHEAFTAMRARGAQVTDLAIIVVAADDAVMPQTREAISHAQAAGIPMIFAINKIDRPNANPDKIKEELAGMNILVEEWGGKYQSQDISAKTGQNVGDLLDKVLLEAELLELQANPDKRAMGTVVESMLDKGRGFVTTLLVEAGTLRVGDPILAGQWSGRVRSMFNERGQRIDEAGPSTPVSMLGMSGAPNAGDKFHIFEDEKEAKNIALKRQQLQREQGIRAQRHITMEEIGRRIALGEFKELNLVVKGDVDGSVEALTDSLQKLSTEKVQVNVIHKAVGGVSETDVLLASASDAIIIAFQVRPSATARKLAEKEGVQVRQYSVIYKAIEEMKEAMEGLLSAKIEEKVTGTAEIRETFKITKVGTIAGCFVLDGKINRKSKVRVIRDGIVAYTGELGSLKRFQDDVKEVTKGFECGLNIAGFNDIKVGDQVEAYEEIEVKQTL